MIVVYLASRRSYGMRHAEKEFWMEKRADCGDRDALWGYVLVREIFKRLQSG